MWLACETVRTSLNGRPLAMWYQLGGGRRLEMGDWSTGLSIALAVSLGRAMRSSGVPFGLFLMAVGEALSGGRR